MFVFVARRHRRPVARNKGVAGEDKMKRREITERHRNGDKMRNSWKDNASCEIGGYAKSGRVSLI